MEHTKEPWGISSEAPWLIKQFDFIGESNVIIGSASGGPKSGPCFPPNPEANALRIVACVNACAETDNETLHQIARMEGQLDFFARIEELQQQRDELAERIKELEAALESRKSTNAGWNAYYALRQRIESAEKVEPIGECTDDDKWNCKYCSKTKTCKALQDKRNFTTPQPAPAGMVLVTKPRFWSREESDAWHKAIPDIHAAFDALAAARKEVK